MQKIYQCILSPILAYMRIRRPQGDFGKYSRDSETARFSILAYNPVFEVRYENGQLTKNGQVIEADPLDYLHELAVKKDHHSDLPLVVEPLALSVTI